MIDSSFTGETTHAVSNCSGLFVSMQYIFLRNTLVVINMFMAPHPNAAFAKTLLVKYVYRTKNKTIYDLCTNGINTILETNRFG